MDLKLGGLPASPAQLQELRDALDVPSNQDLASVTPVIQAGFAVVTISGLKYALLPLDATGSVKASVGHRTGLLASLMTLPGFSGEVAIATDQKSLVVFTGVEGEAYELRPIGRLNALGVDSLTLGHNAATDTTAARSVAVGPNAHTATMGEVALGSATVGVQRRMVAVSGRTTSSADFLALTTDGVAAEGSDTSVKLGRSGLYDIDVVVVAREIGTNNNARFHRRLVLRVGDTGSPAKLYETTPTPDVQTTLAIAAPTLMGVTGKMFAVMAEGLDGKAIQWAAFLDIREMSITV